MPPSRPPPASPGPVYAGLLLAAITTGTAAIWVRLSTAGPLAIAFWRLALAVAVLWPAALWGREIPRTDMRRLWWPSLAAGAALAAHFGTWVTAVQLTTVAHATVLVSLHPLFILAGEWWAFRQPPGAARLAALSIAVAGVTVMTVGTAAAYGSSNWGNLLAVCAAMFYAAYLLLGRRLRQTLPWRLYSAAVYTSAALLLALGALVRGEALSGFPGRQWLIFGAMAAFPTLLGHTVTNWALRFTTATTAAVAQLGEPVVASLLAWIAFQEFPDLWGRLGAMITLGGIGLFLLSQRKREGTTP